MKNAKFCPDRFILSISYRSFAEWLRRNGYYRKFMANLSYHFPQSPSPQYTLRQVIFNVMISRTRTLEDIVVSSFVFASTPEGREFWNRVSDEWTDFCRKCASHF